MSVLDREALEASPLADLHTIASEVGLDGFRRLRKAELIAAILGEDAPPPPPPVKIEKAAESAAGTGSGSDEDDEDDAPRRPRRRGGRNRSRSGSGSASESNERSPEDGDDRPAPRGGGRRGGSAAKSEGNEAPAEGARAQGVVEVLGNGSGFVRVSPPDPSDEDIYISAAQIRRCELVSGDEVSGPTRPPRRSERYPSLARVDTVNGKPADQSSGEGGSRFDELPATFPTERLALGAEDPTVKAIEWLTPFGKGSRVLVVGPSRAGKTEALRRLARALAKQEGIELSIVLSGVRPEELADWASDGAPEPAASLTFAASPDSQVQAIERAVDQAKRVVSRGGDAVVLLDTLAHVPPPAARKAMAAARNVPDGGSLTIVATAEEPIGGESTVIALNAELTSTHRFPALDLLASGTLRAELLVGEAGAEAIAKARAQALD
jgi:transcription termination factor Rho